MVSSNGELKRFSDKEVEEIRKQLPIVVYNLKKRNHVKFSERYDNYQDALKTQELFEKMGFEDKVEVNVGWFDKALFGLKTKWDRFIENRDKNLLLSDGSEKENTEPENTETSSLRDEIKVKANQLNNNLLTLILGRYADPRVVGNYNQANKWNSTGHQFITGMLNGVTQPILASVRDDVERQSRIFRKMLRFTAFIAFPCMFGLSIVTRELILTTVGSKWIDSIPLMQILCIGGAFVPLNALFSNLIISQGKSNIYMWNIISQVLIQSVTVVVTIVLGGSSMVMVIAYACINIVWMLIWQHFACRFIRLSVWQLSQDLLPFIGSAILACGCAWMVSTLIGGHFLISFATKVIVAAITYFIIMKISNAEIMKECLNYLLKKKKS